MDADINTKTLLKVLSIILFIASFLSIFWALITLDMISAFSLENPSDMWVFFLFVPIPIASIVVGFIGKYKKILLQE